MTTWPSPPSAIGLTLWPPLPDIRVALCCNARPRVYYKRGWITSLRTHPHVDFPRKRELRFVSGTVGSLLAIMYPTHPPLAQAPPCLSTGPRCHRRSPDFPGACGRGEGVPPPPLRQQRPCYSHTPAAIGAVDLGSSHFRRSLTNRSFSVIRGRVGAGGYQRTPPLGKAGPCFGETYAFDRVASPSFRREPSLPAFSQTPPWAVRRGVLVPSFAVLFPLVSQSHRVGAMGHTVCHL